MDNQSIYELQLIDCNCNDCKFMERDFSKFKIWEEWNRNLQLLEFEKTKIKAIDDAKKQIPYNEWFVRKCENMTFQFDRRNLISYGNCRKFCKPVSFIPSICQIETQSCFEHRKSMG